MAAVTANRCRSMNPPRFDGSEDIAKPSLSLYFGRPLHEAIRK